MGDETVMLKQDCTKHLWKVYSSEIVDSFEIEDPDDNSSSLSFVSYECKCRCVHCGAEDKYLSSRRD